MIKEKFYEEKNELFIKNVAESKVNKVEKSKTNDFGILNRYSDVPEEEIDMRGIMPGEPMTDPDEIEAFLNCLGMQIREVVRGNF